MSNTEQSGTITTWFGSRGFGFVTIRDEFGRPKQKFFLHISKVLEGTPALGADVSFNINPVREGELFSAVDAEIAPPEVSEVQS